jgi:hypothetical protein
MSLLVRLIYTFTIAPLTWFAFLLYGAIYFLFEWLDFCYSDMHDLWSDNRKKR